MEWFEGSINEAIKIAKEKDALFIVVIRGNADSSKRLLNCFDDKAVADKIKQSHAVAITIDAESQTYIQFAQIYQLVPVPSVFFIGSAGYPLEVLADGEKFSSSPLLTSLENSIEKHRSTTNVGKSDPKTPTEIKESNKDATKK